MPIQYSKDNLQFTSVTLCHHHQQHHVLLTIIELLNLDSYCYNIICNELSSIISHFLLRSLTVPWKSALVEVASLVVQKIKTVYLIKIQYQIQDHHVPSRIKFMTMSTVYKNYIDFNSQQIFSSNLDPNPRWTTCVCAYADEACTAWSKAWSRQHTHRRDGPRGVPPRVRTRGSFSFACSCSRGRPSPACSTWKIDCKKELNFG